MSRYYKVPLSDIEFYGGGSVGDGADGIDIETFMISGRPGMYKVEFEEEMMV